MGSTYLELTNKVLRKINEVELNDTSFASTRGLHSVCKDAVVEAVNEINQQRWEWPFYSKDTTVTLSPGENEYAYPNKFKSADWESFQIMEDPLLNVRNRNLHLIDKDEWYQSYKPLDDDADPKGKGVPAYVFKSHGNKFGVTPSPDKAYTLYYRYYENPNPLVLYNDVCGIPSESDNVIIAGALMHVNLFKENPNGVAISEKWFKNGISNMYNSYIGTLDHVWDRRSTYAQIPLIIKAGNYRL